MTKTKMIYPFTHYSLTIKLRFILSSGKINLIRYTKTTTQTVTIPEEKTNVSVATNNDIPSIKENTTNDVNHKTSNQELLARIDKNNTELEGIISKPRMTVQQVTEESETANVRQEALYVRIKEFIESFGISKRILKIGLGIAVGYTIYHLIRYHQIPLRGFIKGLLFGDTGGSSIPNNLTSTITGHINNITIQIPPNALPEAMQLASSAANSLNSFVEHLSPTIWVVIIGTIGLLIRFKK